MVAAGRGVRPLARRLYAYALFDELIPLYPLYAVIFADHGLSGGQISSLFVLWSAVVFLLEIPSGAWADTFSRRTMLTVGPVLSGAGFALWTFLPSYPAFAAGFVLWGLQSATRSGTLESLVYDALARLDATASYPRLASRSRAIGLTAGLVATAAATPLFALGGYSLVGGVSVASCLLMAVVGARFPVPPARPPGPPGPDGELPEPAGGLSGPDGESEDETDASGGYLAMLRSGLAESISSPPVRQVVLLTAALGGMLAIDEYFPLLATSVGAGPSKVPLLVLLPSLGTVVGALAAARYAAAHRNGLAVVIGTGAVALGVGSALAHPTGFVLIAIGYGLIQLALVVAEVRLQDRIDGPARATVTSVAGFGADVVAVLMYTSYGLGSVVLDPAAALAVLALPPFGIAVVLAASGPHRRLRRPRWSRSRK
ncbi:MAG TPA: MFS transporter [Actinomycetes bacterium]|nr:MFS transporter [Actinomycetes bacterium]